MKPIGSGAFARLGEAARTAMIAMVGAVGLLAMLGWNVGRAQAPAESLQVPVPVTTYDLMLGLVSPATNVIWELSYAEELSDENWQRLDHAAIQLAASASLVSLGGSDAADKGWGNAADWQDWSQQLADMGRAAKQAVDSKDQAGVQMVGDTVIEVCEACHMVYLPNP